MRCIASALLGASLFAAVPAHADGGLMFLIDGDTFSQSFRITNTSTAGERVVRFGFDLGTSGYVFDTVNGGTPNGTAGVAFTPASGSGVTTGLVGPVTVADGATKFEIEFTSFDVNETFIWDIDIDPADANRGATVFGNSLIGTTVYVDFSTGLRASGQLAAVAGNSDAAAFTITSISPIPSAVPEPATWAMMIGGFGLVGGAMRRRNSSVTFA